jgi:hypothetical protein
MVLLKLKYVERQMEQKVEVKTFLINYHCDNCNEVVVKNPDIPVYGNPMQFPYICPSCKTTYVFDDSYPKVIYTYENPTFKEIK